jgi:tetratricopeptide (TPR) repeat protein
MGNLAVCLYNRFLRRREAGDELGALVNLRAAAEIDGSDGRAREWEKAREGLTREQAALAELPFPFLFMPYVFKARSAVDRKRFEDAERLFSRAISINPGSATAFFGRGYARNRLEKSEGARADVLAGFKHLIVRSSQFENMRRIFPRISGQTLDAGAIEEAFSAFHDDTPEGEKGKAPEPSQDDRKLAQRYWSAGRERLRSGRWAEAENYYHWALRCDPFLHPVYGERAYVRSRLGDFRGAFCDYVDCLRFEKLGRSGRLENLIAGHDTVIAWTPDPLAVDKFFSTLKKLAGK